MRQTIKQIAFTTDKNGKPIAYRNSPVQMRWFRIGYEEAKLLIATGQAEQVEFIKWGRWS